MSPCTIPCHDITLPYYVIYYILILEIICIFEYQLNANNNFILFLFIFFIPFFIITYTLLYSIFKQLYILQFALITYYTYKQKLLKILLDCAVSGLIYKWLEFNWFYKIKWLKLMKWLHNTDNKILWFMKYFITSLKTNNNIGISIWFQFLPIN